MILQNGEVVSITFVGMTAVGTVRPSVMNNRYFRLDNMAGLWFRDRRAREAAVSRYTIERLL